MFRTMTILLDLIFLVMRYQHKKTFLFHELSPLSINSLVIHDDQDWSMSWEMFCWQWLSIRRPHSWQWWGSWLINPFVSDWSKHM
jgi:hypothetical protein